MKEESQKFNHNPLLDGLRGVAVVTVMIYHLGIFMPGYKPFLPGGFLGVDIFFVLSGFLITSILIKEFETAGQIHLRKFYIRRFLRLIPALWAFLIFLYFGGSYILPADQAELIYNFDNFFFAFSYLMNWHCAYSDAGLMGNLNHLWSLAIEEQFYILFPLFLVFPLKQKWQPTTIVLVTGGIIIFITVVRIFRVETGTSLQILYYSTESRIDSLLIGCMTSFVFMWKLIPRRFFSTKWFSLLVALASVALIYSLLYLDEKSPELYRTYLSVFAVSTGIIILWLSNNPSDWGKRILANAPLQWMGKISYGLYLWHYLAFEISRRLIDDMFVRVCFGFALAFTAAAISFYLLEIRFLRFKKKFE